MNKKEYTKGFTLAEVMLSLVILGIITVVTIMIVIPKHKEALNRMRVKKAITVYEKVINNIAIENEIKSQADFENWLDTEGNCSKIKDYYFRIIEQDIDEENCMFKTSDGVWWYVKSGAPLNLSLTFPMIAVRKEYLTDAFAKSTESNLAFYFSGRFDDQGILRINDNAYENSLTDNEDRIKAEKKIWDFVLKDKK